MLRLGNFSLELFADWIVWSLLMRQLFMCRNWVESYATYCPGLCSCYSGLSLGKAFLNCLISAAIEPWSMDWMFSSHMFCCSSVRVLKMAHSSYVGEWEGVMDYFTYYVLGFWKLYCLWGSIDVLRCFNRAVQRLLRSIWLLLHRLRTVFVWLD